MSEIINKDLQMRLEHYFKKHDKEKLKGRQIYIWGSQKAAKQTAMMLDEHQIDFIGFIDNDIKAKNKKVKGYYHKSVFYSEELLSKVDSDVFFILTNRVYATSIMKQIINNGFAIDSIINPFHIHDVLLIGNKCNLKCRFCSIHGPYKKFSNKYDDMSVETAKTIMDKLALYKQSISVGALGEPLLHKEFIQILSYAYQKFCETSVISNGVALDANMIDQILKIDFQNTKVLSFSFSVTGFAAEIYNRFQGGDRPKTILNRPA